MALSVQFTTSTDFLAIWGGLTGTLGLLISYFNYKRDKADIKLVITKDWKVMNSPIHNPNEIYISLDVLNKGRRPVTITKAGYVFLRQKGGAILSDSMIYGSKELTEGKNVQYLVKQSDVDFNEISYFSAYDAVGNTYKKYITPFHKAFFYWFLDVTKIKRKQPISSKRRKT